MACLQWQAGQCLILSLELEFQNQTFHPVVKVTLPKVVMQDCKRWLPLQ